MKCPYCGFENIAGTEACESCDEDLTILDPNRPKTAFERMIMRDPLYKLEPKEAICVPENTTVAEAIKKMNEIRAGCVLITNEAGNLVGIVTERDVLFKTSAVQKELAKMPVHKIMSSNLASLEEDVILAYALHQLSVNRFRHIPVLRKGKPPAVLSARDVLKYLAKHLSEST